jgi:predicted nucleic acid-binding protein
MSLFFFDASALAKRYLTETGSAWVDRVTDPAATGEAVVVAELTRVEVAAAIAARARAGTITSAERDALVGLLLQHCDTDYHMIALDAATVSRAVTLTQQHRLRAYDAVQLATALTAAMVLPGLAFVAADNDLLHAAQAEGLAAENPNHYS